MQYKAVIFDLDGVLVFTDKYHFKAWKKLAEKLSIDFTEKDNDRLRGVSRAESLEIILEKYKGKPISEAQKQEYLAEKNDTYRQFLGDMNRNDVSEDVRSTLKKLRESGYRLAIGSSSKNTAYILERTELTDAFDAVADGTMITKSKPDPEVFLKAAELLSESPSNCLVVEDADAGVTAAHAAGMDVAAIGAATKSQRADYNLEAFSDLLTTFLC
ncbi:MAG: beta-phosphoglucomutase [Butyrivibrio sp.]|nr:beta-phosphoglucomutase [Butyrivibrio sp.]